MVEMKFLMGIAVLKYIYTQFYYAHILVAVFVIGTNVLLVAFVRGTQVLA